MNFPKQKPSTMPIHRYAPFIPVDLTDRTWPTKQITTAPKWLRDRMAKLAKMPPPTLKEVETSFRASERARAHFDKTGKWPNIKAEPPPVSGGEAQGKLSHEN